jgi:hypothetical protein
MSNRRTAGFFYFPVARRFGTDPVGMTNRVTFLGDDSETLFSNACAGLSDEIAGNTEKKPKLVRTLPDNSL